MTVAADVDKRLEEGLAHHRAGRAEDAAKLYRAILDDDAKNADALHLLGVLDLQSRRWNQAATWIEQAIQQNDKSPPFHDHLAVVRRNQGRLKDAEDSHRRALEIDPSYASAHNNLATTLKQAGRLKEAAEAAMRAMRAAPDDPGIAANAGHIMMEATAYGAAADAFRVVVDARPDAVGIQEKLVKALMSAARWVEADQILRTLAEKTALPSKLGRQWIEILMVLERHDEATAQAQRLIDRYTQDADVLAVGGIAAWRAGDITAAKTRFQQALVIDDENRTAIPGLAMVHAAVGDVARARVGYRRLLEIDPANIDAYGNLSMLGESELTNADAEQLAELMKSRNLNEHQRAAAAFALGRYLQHASETQAAFDLYRTGNLLRRAHLREQGKTFNAAHHDMFINARLQVFTQGFFRARDGFGIKTQKPVFVVGMPRSGTTLLEHILAAHPQVFGAGELRDIAITALEKMPPLAGGEKTYPECMTDVSAADIEAVAQTYISRLETVGGNAGRIIDKMPFNFLHLGLIHMMFPDAIVIHCKRDLCDVGLSCFTTNFTDSHPWTTDLADIGAYINAYQRLMAHWRQVLPDTCLIEVSYEDLVANPEPETRRLLSSLGLRWSKKCLEAHTNRRTVLTASRADVREPVHQRSVGRWKHYARELTELTQRLRTRTES